MYNLDFIGFFSVNEHEHLHDQSMLVVYLAFHGCQQSCQFVCAFTLLSVTSRTPSPNVLGISILSTPMPLDFQFKEPPLPLEFQKATHGIKV